MLQLRPVNLGGGVRVCGGVPSRSSQPGSHGGAQSHSIEVAAVEVITRQSTQSQVQVQQGLVNRPLNLEITQTTSA